jgi:hypothetical protein
VLVCLVVLAATAMSLLSLRQARIVQVNRMNHVWTELQAQKLVWQRLRVDIAAAARPERLLLDEDSTSWSAAVDHQLNVNPSE